MATKTLPASPEIQNLAKNLSAKERVSIAALCIDEYKADLDARSEWDEMNACWKKLFFMRDVPKSPPWQGSSTESVPMLAEACGQFRARAKAALFPSKSVVKCIPTANDPDDKLRARMDRVSKYMNFQLMDWEPDYKKNKFRLLTSLPLHGSMFTKTFFDPIRQRVRITNIRATDLVVPYGTGSRELEDLPRKTENIWLPKWQAQYLYKLGHFIEMPEVYLEGKYTRPVDDAVDQATGQSRSNQVEDYCLILEQHRFYDLDDDGIEEPYIVKVCGQSEKLLAVHIRYETDQAGIATHYKDPIEYYTHYPFIDNPDGFYGLGYGLLLGPINTSVNKILRQIIDAGTLANIGNMSGFISSQLGIKGGDVEMKLGKFTKTTSGMEDITKGIYQFKFPGPPPVLNDVMRSLTLRGDRLAMVTETITGQAERVMQPTTVMALIEQAQIIFSDAQENVIDAWSKELDKVYRLNYKYPERYVYYLSQQQSNQPATIGLGMMPGMDQGGQMQPQQMPSQEDFAPDMRVVPVADPKQATRRERLAMSDAEFQTGQTCPFIMQSPLHMYHLYKRRFEELGVTDISAILPDMEQQLMLQEQMKQALQQAVAQGDPNAMAIMAMQQQQAMQAQQEQPEPSSKKPKPVQAATMGTPGGSKTQTMR